jgi:XTP/dITP diphosphohydrolase
LDISLVTLDRYPEVPDVVEDGQTLEENALKKARAVRDATGECALADDTGLEVDALDGAPGVFSARYAGENVTYEDNNRKLLGELRGVPEKGRTARFRCVMALALTRDVGEALHEQMKGQPTGSEIVVPPGARKLDAFVTEGILDGRIAGEMRGSSGFGYDRVFELPDSGKTLSEIGEEAKNRISHRYRSLVEIRELLLRWNLAKPNAETAAHRDAD